MKWSYAWSSANVWIGRDHPKLSPVQLRLMTLGGHSCIFVQAICGLSSFDQLIAQILRPAERMAGMPVIQVVAGTSIVEGTRSLADLVGKGEGIAWTSSRTIACVDPHERVGLIKCGTCDCGVPNRMPKDIFWSARAGMLFVSELMSFVVVTTHCGLPVPHLLVV